MAITVLFFARGRELAGRSETSVEVAHASDTAQLLKYLLEEYPKLAEIMETSVFSLNQEYLAPNQKIQLKDQDEVAIIPPVSGG